MCGIAGIYQFNGVAPSRALLEKMQIPLNRRGPDSGGIHIQQGVGFAHRRLSIIDLSNASHQPMCDAQNGNMLVFNGAIYNYQALRQQLQSLGHTFTSAGDTETILKAYAQWGEACVTHFIGMFAFALWDATAQTLFIARDRLGIKPFYYSLDHHRFCFGSNLQSVLAAGGVNTQIDPIALHHQLTLHAVVPAPHTLILGVRKLEPGCSMTLSAQGVVRQQRYWQLTAQRPQHAISDQEWQERILASLKTAVKRRLDIADVPVGVLLSGGLDSSLLVALAAEVGAKDLLTFSIGFEDQPEEKGSEFEFSDPVAARYQTQHHKFLIPNGDVLKRLPDAIANMAEPMVGQDAVAFYLLSEQVAKTVKVVQSGQGADEVFGGYFWYAKMHNSTTVDPLQRFAEHYFDRDHNEWLATTHSRFHEKDYTSELIRARLTEAYADEFIDQVLRLDTTMLIVDDPVKRVDNMTMAHGLEARVPFLDHELVELAMQMPPHLKLADGGKTILKHIARGRIPDAVIDRPKGYFPMPALKYVRGEFYDMMHAALSSQAARERGLFNTQYVAKLLERPEAPEHFTRIVGSKLWHCALLELWLQKHIDGAST